MHITTPMQATNSTMSECNVECVQQRTKLYVVYGVILATFVSLALCHFLVALCKRRRIKEIAKEYYLHRESFANLAVVVAAASQKTANGGESKGGGGDDNDFKITTDGGSQMAIEIPDNYNNPFPLLSNGLEKNGGPKAAKNHGDRPLQMEVIRRSGGENEGENVTTTTLDPTAILSHRNMKTNIVQVDVHSEEENRRRGGAKLSSSSLDEPTPALRVATVSQSYNNIRQAPVVISDSMSGILSRPSRPTSAVSLYDISDIVSSSPETGRKKSTPKKSPKTC